MTRRQPPVYTQAAEPPPGPARAIWRLLRPRFASFSLQWSESRDAFAVVADGTRFRLSQHEPIAADALLDLPGLVDGRISGGNEPRAIRDLVAVLGSWRSTQEIAVDLNIPKSLAYDRISRALRLGVVEGRAIAGHEHRKRPPRQWRRKEAA